MLRVAQFDSAQGFGTFPRQAQARQDPRNHSRIIRRLTRGMDRCNGTVFAVDPVSYQEVQRVFVGDPATQMVPLVKRLVEAQLRFAAEALLQTSKPAVSAQVVVSP